MEENNFDHSKAATSDKISLISELEHIRRHLLRAAVSVWSEEDNSEAVKYLIMAKKAQSLRREYMRKHFGELEDADWCSFKTAACLKQLAYEVCEGDAEELREIDDFADEILGGALGVDLSDCASCKGDRNAIQ